VHEVNLEVDLSDIRLCGYVCGSSGFGNKPCPLIVLGHRAKRVDKIRRGAFEVQGKGQKDMNNSGQRTFLISPMENNKQLTQ